jgi:hypothetical protein
MDTGCVGSEDELNVKSGEEEEMVVVCIATMN